MTPANNHCNRFSVIVSVIETGDKFLTGVNDMEMDLLSSTRSL